jgi:hypothetical protein
MNASSRTRLALSLVSLMAVTGVSAQERPAPGGQPPAGHAAPQGRPVRPAGPPPQARAGADARFAHGAIVARDFGGHAYRGRLAWEGGRWHHEMHDGRMGWWWDVGGVWYFYPQRIDGPPTYVSEDYADDVVYGGPPPGDYPPAPGGYPAPAAAYAPPPPPPPPPPPDPAASAVGGAVVGGVLGGLLTGRASGAAAGAVLGGATGAIAGAAAASRPGYYLAQGNCYYRYPSGQYVPADPRWCY